MNEPRGQPVLRWIVRGAAALIVGIVLLITIGEGGFNPFQLTWNEAALMTAFWVAIAGLAIACRWEWLGGSLAVGGMLFFYIGHRWTAGTWPAGRMFLLVALTASLVLLTASFSAERSSTAKAPKGSPS